MMYTHVLLEVYCELDLKGQFSSDICPCKLLEGIPSYNCLFHSCPYVTFTSCENALCYVDERSIAEEVIAMGDNAPELDKWKQICFKKMDEAYEEYVHTCNNAPLSELK